MKRLLTKPDFLVVFAVPLFLLVLTFGYARWNKSNVVQEDVVSYYSYLPATFIYGDLSMSYAKGNDFFADKVWGTIFEKEGGGVAFVQKYTMGMAVFYSPFFLAGHLSAVITGAETDGYSTPYMFWLQLAALFYLFWGLFFLRKMLRLYFDPWITAVVLTGLCLGTNLFYYSIGDSPMPHAFMFGAVSLFFYLSHRFWEKPSTKGALWIGLVGGLLVLTRPNHLLLWGIPLLYGIKGLSDFKERLRFFLKNYRFPLIWGICGFLILLPQLLYWKSYSDTWFFWSYGEEGFNFLAPHWLESWFGFRKGWLIYTPLMAFALAGFIFLRRKAKGSFWPILIVVILVSWLYASWWCWWYGGSFGMRPYIDLYPLLAFPLAALLTKLAESLKRSWVPALLVGFFCLLNVFQTWQYTAEMIHPDAMTFQSYTAVFGKTTPPANFEDLLEHPDYEAALNGD